MDSLHPDEGVSICMTLYGYIIEVVEPSEPIESFSNKSKQRERCPVNADIIMPYKYGLNLETAKTTGGHLQSKIE